MPQDIASFPFSEHQLDLLNSKGFLTVEDVKELSASELSKELSVTSEDALDILQVVARHGADDVDYSSTNDGEVSSVSAYALLQQEEEQTPIVTFCAALDNMIGGGVPPGKITEFCGTPGAGKTQLGIQLSVDVQIPEAFGGVEGEAVYIDCEGSFVGARVVEIAEAALEHLANVSDDDDTELKNALNNITLESVLSRIHVYRCYDYVQLVALSYVLPEFLEQHPNVKLIVLDSIAFHFRYDFEDMALRSRVLQGLVQRFMEIAHNSKLAVVFMNQMTTKVSKHGDGVLVPALGQVWGHACTIRILLGIVDGQRYARLLKSPCHREGTVQFDISKQGVRDVDVSSGSPPKITGTQADTSKGVPQVVPEEELPANRSKRPRISS